MKVLVTGATGAIGPRVIHALHQAGYQICAFSIDAPAEGMFPQSVKFVIGDITDRGAVQSAMQGMGAVVHMAALLHIINPELESREKYFHVNVGGTAIVTEAAIKAGVKRLVLFSTIAVYGYTIAHVFNEQSPTNPNTHYAQTKLAAEKIVLNSRRADGRPMGTVLRLSAVYGSRIKGNYERLTRALAHHRFIAVGDGLNRRTMVYDKDVGRAAVLAVSHPAAEGGVFNVTDGGFHTLNNIIESICLGLGRKPPHFSLPLRPTRTIIGLMEKASRSVGVVPLITRDLIEKYIEDIAVDGNLIQNKLGFIPQFNLITGWEETIKEMRARGEL